MKYWFLILAFSFIDKACFANQDVVYGYAIGKSVKIISSDSYNSGGFQLKKDILETMIYYLVEDRFPNKQPLYIILNHSDKNQYSLGYGQLSSSFQPFFKTKNVDGIIISIQDNNLDILKILNLINAAYLNLDAVKNNQTQILHLPLLNKNDSVPSVSKSIINDYLNMEIKDETDIFNQKVYPNNAKYLEFYDLAYYYQNKKFHIYYNDKQYWNENIDTLEKVILTVPDIYEIVMVNKTPKFLFTNDSTFFFYSKTYSPKLIGPHFIEVSSVGRYNAQIKRDELVYEKYLITYAYFDTGYVRKNAAYFVDKNVVINNYEEVFRDNLDKILNPSVAIESSKANLAILILVILLGGSIVTIFILWRKQ